MEWKTYSPKYHCLTGGNYLDTTYDKEWKEFITVKKQEIVKSKKGWGPKALNKYEVLLQDKKLIWEAMEIRIVESTMAKNIGSIAFYHERAIEIVTVPLPFPTGFLIQ